MQKWMKNLETLTWTGLFPFVFLMLVMSFSFTVKAEDKVIIYGLESEDAKVISIPADYPQSYQILEGTNASYRVIKGDSVRVSPSGEVTPRYTYYYKDNGVNKIVQEGEPYDTYRMNVGDTVIEVKTNDKTYVITVCLESYTNVYADKVIDNYINENFSVEMSDMEKMEMIAKFPAGYDYSGKYSDVSAMVVHGGGDCWASTDAIIKVCEKLGISAWPRDAHLDMGAGSGHMNAMAELNGVYYELDAGYSMPKKNGYRYYKVLVRDTLFGYRSYSADSLVIYQYDGPDTGVLIVPSSINGKKVVRISEKTFRDTGFSKIVLPDTITGIGDYAFAGCSNLQSMVIPESVTTIGNFMFDGCSGLKSVEIPESVTAIGDCAFRGCSSLQNLEIPASVASIGINPFGGCDNLMGLNVAQSNENYVAQDGVLYNKDKTILLSGPAVPAVVIPKTVTRIEKNAFIGNENLMQITIPESVESLGDSAFSACDNLSTVEIKGNTLCSIGESCFAYDRAITEIHLPASAKSLEWGVFRYCSGLKTVYFYGDAPTFKDGLFEWNKTFVFYPKDNDTWTEDKLKNYGGNITWLTWGAGQQTVIDATALDFDKLGLDVIVTVEDEILKENENYTVDYDYDWEAETVTVTVMGMGDYAGTVTATFDTSRQSASDMQENEETEEPVYVWTWTVDVQPEMPDNVRNDEFYLKQEQEEEVKTNSSIGMMAYVTLSKTAFTYNGKNQTPIVTVQDDAGNILAASSYRVTYPESSKKIGNYTVVVTLQGSSGDTLQAVYQIVPKGTGISKLTAREKGFNVKWKKQEKQTTGYQIQYASSKSFKNAKTVTVGKNKTVSKSITKLKGGRKYYVRVRTYKTVRVDGKKTKICSGWSKAKSVKVK